jgi:hypothetical protein
MILGVVQAPVHDDQAVIEVIEPDKSETVMVTVPAAELRAI